MARSSFTNKVFVVFGLLFTTLLTFLFLHGEMPRFMHVKPDNIRLFQMPNSLNIKQNNTLSAFYTCHNEIAAVNKVLHYFRASYPDSPVFMFNDAGLPFLRYLAKRYHVHYHYYRQHAVMEPHGNYWNTTDKAYRYIKDLIHTAVQTMSDWVVILEDDTIVLQPFDTKVLTYDQNGAPVDYVTHTETSSWWKIVQNYIRIHYPNSKLYYRYNGRGGCILRGAFLRSLAENMTKIYEQVDTFRDLTLNHQKSKSMPSDQVVTFITQVNGGTMGRYEHEGDVWPIQTWMSYWTNNLHVLHGDKTAYVGK
jgi:hypothetical protein